MLQLYVHLRPGKSRLLADMGELSERLAGESPTGFDDVNGGRLPVLQPVSPASLTDDTSAQQKTITFGDVSIPPRFIGNIGPRNRLYVNMILVTSTPVGERSIMISVSVCPNFTQFLCMLPIVLARFSCSSACCILFCG